VFVVNLVLYV